MTRTTDVTQDKCLHNHLVKREEGKIVCNDCGMKLKWVTVKQVLESKELLWSKE